MSKDKIKCPDWLKDPTKYDVAKIFSLQDWFEQISSRHGLFYQLENNELECPINEIFEKSIKLISAVTINSSFKLMQQKPSLFQESDFKELGLINDSVWSQTISEVKLRNKINNVVQDKHDYISEDFPNKICEQLANHDQNFLGIAAVNVDLFQDDKQIKKEFNKWLKSTRNFYRYNDFAHLKFDNWAKYRSLAYWDLMLWIKENNYSYGQEDTQIPKATMQRWLLEDKFLKNHYENYDYNLIEASKKYYLVMSKEQMFVALERRFLTDHKGSTSNSAVKIIKKYQQTKSNKMNILEYFESKGFNTK